jgi:hypothetical protein
MHANLFANRDVGLRRIVLTSFLKSNPQRPAGRQGMGLKQVDAVTGIREAYLRFF